MSENKRYTIIVKQQRVTVSEAVYRAYHQEREAERYQRKCITDNEYSLERFQEDGVNIEHQLVACQDFVDKLVHREQLEKLWLVLQALPQDERSLIEELFFNEKSERSLAAELGVPRMTLSDRKRRILRKLRNITDK